MMDMVTNSFFNTDGHQNYQMYAGSAVRRTIHSQLRH